MSALVREPAKEDRPELRALARFIVGDFDGAPRSRGSYGLQKLFSRAGIKVDYDGGSKLGWTARVLAALAPTDLSAVIIRLLSPEEYASADTARTAEAALSAQLISVGFRITSSDGNAVLTRSDAVPDSGTRELLSTGGLAEPDFEQLDLSNQEAQLLVTSWDEILRCYMAGAYLATTIMLGSVLEAIFLLALKRNRAEIANSDFKVRDARGQDVPLEKWTLSQMIDAASHLGWASRKLASFSHGLREFRNFVHPELRHRVVDVPRNDECLISALIVRAVVSDLRSKINEPPK